MDYLDYANLLTATALVSTSIFLFLITLRMKIQEPKLRRSIRSIQISTLLLGTFLLLHGLYHLTIFTNEYFLAFSVLGPLSTLFLLMFSIYVYAKIFVPTQSGAYSRERNALQNHSSILRRKIIILASVALTIASFAYLAIAFNNPDEIFNFYGIVASAGLFSYMVLKDPSPREWHFGFALITITWSVAEIPYVLSVLGVMSLSFFDTPGEWLHFISMSIIGAFVCYKIARLSFTREPRKPKQPLLEARTKRSRNLN